LNRVKQGKSKKIDHRPFNDLPCILPLTLRSLNETEIPSEGEMLEQLTFNNKISQ